ncbi:N-acetylmuramoyl-L-alanine amidase [Bdellovibrio sp. HCB288]|uniref:N-acetylmuramoyl-L-alanine amidase n=1 Tax=Bdellovibrio sp. HCB288 TaxID=3394355 RepID=UPI0039B4FDE5
MWKAIVSFFKPKSKLVKSASKVVSCADGGMCPINVNPIKATQKGSDYYPKAVIYKNKMKTRGGYKEGYPLGAIVHFTAGHFSKGEENARAAIDDGIKNGYAYLCIGNDGKAVQAHPLKQWGYHAGESAWKGILGAVSDDTVGIEMNCAGKVEKVGENRFKTWFGTYLTANEVRYVTQAEYGCPTGYYHKYSAAQEATLIEILVWLVTNDPTGKFKIDFILGHHEVAGMLGIGKWRKNDPGGSLSMTMPQLRKLVQDKVKALGV